MIARLRGTVAEVVGDHLVLDVQGVGYDVLVPQRTAEAARRDGSLTLHVHTAVREDAITLYGFATLSDKELFERLISVSQVGPKMALGALSALTADALALAINQNDLRTLSSVPGIGKKTAERLVLELRGKLAIVLPTTLPPDDPLPSALARLGYRAGEIEGALAKLQERGLGEAPLQTRLSECLRILSGSH